MKCKNFFNIIAEKLNLLKCNKFFQGVFSYFFEAQPRSALGDSIMHYSKVL